MLLAENFRSFVSSFAENTVLEPGSNRQSPLSFTSSIWVGIGSQCTDRLVTAMVLCTSVPVTGGALMPLLTRACADAISVDGANVVPSKRSSDVNRRYVGDWSVDVTRMSGIGFGEVSCERMLTMGFSVTTWLEPWP